MACQNVKGSISVSVRKWGWMLTSFFTMLLLLPCVQSRHRCPYDGQLALEPSNPFIFVGGTSRMCCRPVIAPDDSDSQWTRQNVTLVFSCNPSNDIAINQPIELIRTSSIKVCVEVNATALTQRVQCQCQVEDQPQCHARQSLTIDEPLPLRPEFTCMTYANANVTCTLQNPRHFLHSERVTTQITWKQVDSTGFHTLSPTRTKVCSSVNICAITHHDEIIFGLPLVVNISLKMEYKMRPAEPGDFASVEQKDVRVVSSDWVKFDLEAHVKIEPLRASVLETTNSTIKVTWEKQYMYYGEKVVRINCTIDNATINADFDSLLDQYFVREIMDFTMTPMEFVIPNLRPSVDYRITLETRPVLSHIWSDPARLTAITNGNNP